MEDRYAAIWRLILDLDGMSLGSILEVVCYSIYPQTPHRDSIFLFLHEYLEKRSIIKDRKHTPAITI